MFGPEKKIHAVCLAGGLEIAKVNALDIIDNKKEEPEMKVEEENDNLRINLDIVNFILYSKKKFL